MYKVYDKDKKTIRDRPIRGVQCVEAHPYKEDSRPFLKIITSDTQSIRNITDEYFTQCIRVQFFISVV